MSLKYDLFDIMASAVMSNPVLIVEGKDDYQIYSNLTKVIGKAIDVYPSNYFKDTNSGCTGVISCLEILQPKFLERDKNLEKVLGIIDKDSRLYRNEMRDDLLGLFVTKYYSIETYFVNDECLKNVLSKITYATKNDFKADAIQLIKNRFQILVEDLYIMSLEALKNACEVGYSSVLGYDYSENKIVEQGSKNYYLGLLQSKINDLQDFAFSKNVSIDDVKLIAKGKWYLYAFAYVIANSVSDLKINCRAGIISQCKACCIGNYNDCLLNTRQPSYKAEVIHDMLLEYFDINELSDIIGAINRLK